KHEISAPSGDFCLSSDKRESDGREKDASKCEHSECSAPASRRSEEAILLSATNMKSPPRAEIFVCLAIRV
ncbi:MAG: hypothetical protein WCF93_03455, partial [Candidatus Moraniibacteriota bacterium]